MTIAYVIKHVAAIQHDTHHINDHKHENVIVELQLPPSKHRAVIINAYWSPGQHSIDKQWLQALWQTHKGKDIIVAGDFNCHNVSWGYQGTTAPGRTLEQAASDAHLTLLNDTFAPTRTGSSVERDTPDLTWHVGQKTKLGKHLREPRE